MAENKTQPTSEGVDAFLAGVTPPRRRAQAEALKAIFDDVTGWQACMWGPSIVGYGRYHYTYASGREGDWMRVGFSPQKRHTSLYLMGCDADARAEMLSRLGPHRAGVGCVYVTRLDAVDEEVLREMIAASYTGTAAQAL